VSPAALALPLRSTVSPQRVHPAFINAGNSLGQDPQRNEGAEADGPPREGA